MRTWAIWREGREWWACYYSEDGCRIEEMHCGFKTQGAARWWAKTGATVIEGRRKKHPDSSRTDRAMWRAVARTRERAAKAKGLR
jgi:hypothetical protein